MRRLFALVLLALACGIGFAKEAAPLVASRADLAQDLRRELRTLIKQGKTDAEIREFMVSRYGDFLLLVYMRRRNRAVGKPQLSEEDTRRAEALLKEQTQ